jgi:hypothetical protein
MKIDQACIDIDECAQFPCAENASCINNQGSFACTCNQGFNGEPFGLACEDFNECAGNHGCPENSVCANTIGSYSCQAVEGYRMADGKIEDVDECLNSPCHHNADCENTVGDFECICKGLRNIFEFYKALLLDGYHGTGLVCDLAVNCFADNGGCSHFCEIPAGCSCPGSCWTLDSDNKTCIADTSKSAMQCQSGSMDISIDNCLYDDGKEYQLSLIDNDCKLENDEGFGAEVDFDDCGTMIEKENNQIVMSQTVSVETLYGGSLTKIPGENFLNSQITTY